MCEQGDRVIRMLTVVGRIVLITPRKRRLLSLRRLAKICSSLDAWLEALPPALGIGCTPSKKNATLGFEGLLSLPRVA